MKKTLKLISLLIIFVLLFSFTGCFFKSPNADKFNKAIDEVMGDEATYRVSMVYTSDNAPYIGCNRIISYFGHGVSCIYYEFDNSKNSYDYFNRYSENFQDIFQGDYYRGEYKNSASGSRGYVYMSGTISVDAITWSMFGSGETFGGVYYEGNVVVLVLSHSGPSSNIYAGDFLRKIGFPIFDT